MDGYGTHIPQRMDMVAWIQVKRGSLGMEIPLKTLMNEIELQVAEVKRP